MEGTGRLGTTALLLLLLVVRRGMRTSTAVETTQRRRATRRTVLATGQASGAVSASRIKGARRASCASESGRHASSENAHRVRRQLPPASRPRLRARLAGRASRTRSLPRRPFLLLPQNYRRCLNRPGRSSRACGVRSAGDARWCWTVQALDNNLLRASHPPFGICRLQKDLPRARDALELKRSRTCSPAQDDAPFQARTPSLHPYLDLLGLGARQRATAPPQRRRHPAVPTSSHRRRSSRAA